MNKLFPIIGLAAAQISVSAAPATAQQKAPKQKQQKKMNILFIAVDDLKANTRAYGDPYSITPAMDRIAREGIVFRNAYCQQAVSGPTRASLMTGLRPDRTRIWDLATYFRQLNPNVVTLPEYLMSQGYETAATGKLYHMSSTPGHDPQSWSVPYETPKSVTYINVDGKRKSHYPIVECADVPDSAYTDGRRLQTAMKLLDRVSKGDKPFFLAVGFSRPHLPFTSPKKYWDLYDRDKFELAPYQEKAVNSPDIAYHASNGMKKYSDMPQFESWSIDPSKRLSVEKQKEILHGYYAATSYTDAQIGKLLNELDRKGLADNTIVVIWGDHGWHLGDHSMWQKMTNFEQTTHVLFMMRVPGMPAGVQATGVSEFVDIFPTLCELTDVPTPAWIDGVSLVPAIEKPSSFIKEYAMSQYPRGKNVMGYTIRTARFRYTEWLSGGFRTYMPYDGKYVVGREMYDYEKDPLEKESVIGKEGYRADQKKMEALFAQCMKREYARCIEYGKRADFHEPQNMRSDSADDE